MSFFHFSLSLSAGASERVSTVREVMHAVTAPNQRFYKGSDLTSRNGETTGCDVSLKATRSQEIWKRLASVRSGLKEEEGQLEMFENCGDNVKFRSYLPSDQRARSCGR